MHSQHTRRITDLLRPGRAVILDTETTGLVDPDIIEIGVIDAFDGAVLLHSYVRPQAPMEPAAAAVHGISDRMLEAAPGWSQVLPLVEAACANRTILAWNAAFDLAAVASTCRRRGLRTHLMAEGQWMCAMQLVAEATDRPRQALHGPHSAIGDCDSVRLQLRNALRYAKAA